MTGFALILPAAGTGSRLNESVPKPYIEIEGQTVLERTIRQFHKTGLLQQLIIPTSSLYIDRAREIVGFAFPDLTTTVIEGGSERQFSIWNAIEQLSSALPLVAIHDAVRPFVSPESILKCADKAIETGAAILAVPAKDTIKRIETKELTILETPDRLTLWQAQTPQFFSQVVLRKAYQKAIEDGFLGTDDASLVEYIGHSVSIVEGERENFKITYPVDLTLAKVLLETNKG
jgi:2-C-methyl-D-erythritol 4-phosphate cytidylyltransferase